MTAWDSEQGGQPRDRDPGDDTAGHDATGSDRGHGGGGVTPPDDTHTPHDDAPDDGRIVHIAPDDLAALAIDPFDAGPDETAHLEWCTRCQQELDTVRRVTERTRRAEPSEPDLTPPESVWDSVVRELSASGDLRPVAAPAEPASRRRRRRPWAAVGAVAAVVAAVVIVAAVALLPPRDDAAVVATADLEALADVSAASAELVTGDDGRVLRFDALDLPPTDGYYELWLLTEDGQGLVSLGPVDDGERFAIPESVDTDRFPLVDISREPIDGDPNHSGDSVLRGPLEQA